MRFVNADVIAADYPRSIPRTPQSPPGESCLLRLKELAGARRTLIRIHARRRTFGTLESGITENRLSFSLFYFGCIPEELHLVCSQRKSLADISYRGGDTPGVTVAAFTIF